MINEVINPQGVRRADIAVFIPSFEEKEHIQIPVRKVDMGLRNFYPDQSSVLINCDNASADGTREAFFAPEVEVPRIYVSTPPAVVGKGANLKNIFELAAGLEAKAVLVLDANLISIKSTWIRSLAQPILAGADFTAPLYLRHKHDAPVTRMLVYPLTRALFGRRVLQPICVDHAFSARLVEIYRQHDWRPDDAGYRSDMEMLYLAIANQAPVWQSYMAHPRVSRLSRLDYDLARAFTLVAGALFDLMTETWDFWRRIRRSRPTALYGADESPVNPPPLVEIDQDYMIDGFIELGRKYRPLWRDIFPAALMAEVDRETALAASGHPLSLSNLLWRQLVFETALAYRRAPAQDRPDLTAALSPLFLARLSTSGQESLNLSSRQYYSVMETEAVSFETAKPELVERWGEMEPT
ncbi:MAG: glycosyltransferase [Candidatus Adiutrix sp.]|jgi:glycosyltransferase involved in cell wall biosynthesis|nr:glycosyltransferase [Candidatus Adiutrix sp.]